MKDGAGLSYLERERGPPGLQELLLYHSAWCTRQCACPSISNADLQLAVEIVKNPEESRFMLVKLTTDCILALCVLVEHQCEF